MPVRNAIPYLSLAIESILSQSYTEFEFVIGDDASDDGSTELIIHYSALDPRIRMMRSEVQLGPAGSSAWVAGAARAPLVARMDADDLCHPDRLRQQVQALLAHPGAVIVTSLLQLIDRKSKLIRGADYSLVGKSAQLPAPHSSIMYRNEAYLAVGGYQVNTDYFEDRVLIDKLQTEGDALIIAAPLLSYRMGGASARLSDDRNTVENRLNRFEGYNKTASAQDDAQPGINPRVYRSLGSLQLWSRQPVRILHSMIQRMRRRPAGAAVKMLLWALFVTVAPGLARSGARASLVWRNWRVRKHVRPNHLYRWSAHAQPEDLGPAGL